MGQSREDRRLSSTGTDGGRRQPRAAVEGSRQQAVPWGLTAAFGEQVADGKHKQCRRGTAGEGAWWPKELKGGAVHGGEQDKVLETPTPNVAPKGTTKGKHQTSTLYPKTQDNYRLGKTFSALGCWCLQISLKAS